MRTNSGRLTLRARQRPTTEFRPRETQHVYSATALPTLTAKDLASDQEVRWCPGCGDYSILAQMKKVLAPLGIPREKMVFISGIGCSSRFPYYMNTYGFHTIHGRAPAFATGLKAARPDLTGLGHHRRRRRPVDRRQPPDARHPPQRRPEDHAVQQRDLRPDQGPVFADLAAGHQAPRRRPLGSIDNPLRPLSLAIGAEATFVARTIDVDIKHLTETLQRAAAHKGTAFVEVYQNCKIFNDGVFEYATDKSVKADNMLYLEHGKPLIFGKDRNKGIRLQRPGPGGGDAGQRHHGWTICCSTTRRPRSRAWRIC